MEPYWKISADMATECAGYRSGENVFHSVRTLAGVLVCAHAAAGEFPGLFLNRRPVALLLSAADFPVPVRPVLLPPVLPA